MASDELFDRKASFVFGLEGKLGRSYSDLRIKFKIIKTSDSKPNKSNVMVYNLTKDSRTLAEKKGIVFLLSAGYNTTQELIFSGDVARTITELDGSDYITTFEAGDGEKAFQIARVEKSFQEGVDIKDVFKEVITSLGKTIKDISAVPSSKIVNGVSLTGLSRTHMDELTNRYGLEWSIQDGGIQVLKKKGSSKETAILLSPDTGLVGIPKKKVDGTPLEKEEGLIELVSFLQPQIRPGRIINLQSQFIKGEFICRKVTHVGDTHGQDWYSQIEAIKR